MKKLLTCLLVAVLSLGCALAMAETAPAAIIDFADGKFYAQSGKVYTVTGEDQTKNGYDWSVYKKARYSSEYTEAELIKKVYDSEYVITLDELPEIY